MPEKDQKDNGKKKVSVPILPLPAQKAQKQQQTAYSQINHVSYPTSSIYLQKFETASNGQSSDASEALFASSMDEREGPFDQIPSSSNAFEHNQFNTQLIDYSLPIHDQFHSSQDQRNELFDYSQPIHGLIPATNLLQQMQNGNEVHELLNYSKNKDILQMQDGSLVKDFLDYSKKENDLKQRPEGQILDSLNSSCDYYLQKMQDGRHVLDFLNSTAYTEEVHSWDDNYSKKDLGRVASRALSSIQSPNSPQNTRASSIRTPQVTRASLIQDGRDLVNYIRLNRYTDDVFGTSEYTISDAIDEFEQAKEMQLGDEERLGRAVERLKLFSRHLK